MKPSKCTIKLALKRQANLRLNEISQDLLVFGRGVPSRKCLIKKNPLAGWKLGTRCPASLTVANVRSPSYTSVYPPTCDTNPIIEEIN
jgi:hypothetical protein